MFLLNESPNDSTKFIFSADELVLVHSFEDIHKRFSEHMDERFDNLTSEHLNQLQDLMKLKANWERRVKRSSFYLEPQTVNK